MAVWFGKGDFVKIGGGCEVWEVYGVAGVRNLAGVCMG